MSILSRYTRWLHTGWPAGTIEKLPEVGPDGATTVPGVRIVGDLTGIPLLKFSADTGARAVRAILAESDFASGRSDGDGDTVDVAIVGAGVSGISAALEAKKAGLSFTVFEAAQAFSTIVNFPKAKPIYTYPTEMTPAGELRVSADVKERLLEELEEQRESAGVEPVKAHVHRVERDGNGFKLHVGRDEVRRARRVILAIGRTGNYRKLGVPGEELDKVYNRLYDPREYGGKNVVVFGGGDSALESAIALTCAGAHVTLSYRKPSFSRPKPENIAQIEALAKDPAADVQVERPSSDRVNTAMTTGMREPGDANGSLRLLLGSKAKAITETEVVITDAEGKDQTLPNDVTFAMIGREAPLDFFRRSGIRITGELSPMAWTMLGLFTALMALVYVWKAWWIGGTDIFQFSPQIGGTALRDVLARATGDPGSWFTLAYTACIVGFGIARIRRRKTPYVTRQTLTLMGVQLVPLFLLPVIVLPWLDAHGAIPVAIEQNLFPGDSYWRAYGFILAWPLFLWNLATGEPLWWWIVIGLVQTFVIIPLIVWRWGKGAYCGWICSCGALAETMGDQHRQKMWHGPLANRFNMTGQVILVIAALVTLFHVLAWSPALRDTFAPIVKASTTFYKAGVDIAIGGAIGLGFYFWFSGRVWCRFACPLAALMHIYARFTRFRIFSDKKKCISCNVCTSVCHQGIDIMNFANKGLPMKDPECVRCSACVQSCPTGVLTFGRLGSDDEPILDRVPASPVHMREG